MIYTICSVNPVTDDNGTPRQQHEEQTSNTGCTCPCVQTPQNGEAIIYGNRIGDLIRFFCDAGYEMVGSTYIHCAENGEWTDNPPHCRDIEIVDAVTFSSCTVDVPGPDTHLYVNFQKLSSNATLIFPHGTEIQARCRDIGKFVFHGSPKFSCMDGDWSGEMPHCIPNEHNTGNFTPTVEFEISNGHGVITPTGQLAVRPGSKVVFTCHYNHTDDWFLYWVNEHRNSYPTRETSNSTLQLTINSISESDSGQFSCYNLDKVGRTSITVVVEDWKCLQTLLSSHNVILEEEDSELGGKAVFRCAEGYSMEGANQSTCMPGGKWHPEPPSCKGITCPCVEVGPWLIMRTRRGESFHHLYFSCIPGYYLQGSSDIVCNSNGSWSDVIPTCQEVDCGDLPGFTEGRLVGNKTTMGAIFNFRCSNGVIPEGYSHFTRCQADGTWSHSAPACLEMHCNQSDVECFNLNCTDHAHYVVPRDEKYRRWGCCAGALFDMRESYCRRDSVIHPCSSGYGCENGNCVSNGVVCDGNNDCSDGTDERGCSPCDGTKFKCLSGQCLEFSYVCDGKKDCHDGSDEAHCSRGLRLRDRSELGWCGRDQFTCPSERDCVPLNKICDGNYDCEGGYDEEICGDVHCNSIVEKCRTASCPGGELAFIPVRTRYAEWGCCRDIIYSRKLNFCSARGVYPCPMSSFRCRNGNCVPPFWRCDSENDCSDGSDEEGCHGCSASEYNCADGQCVPVSSVCDKTKDCYNGMDECHCARSDGTWCGGRQYRCANDKCIPREHVCNHINDCGDGSDEVKCMPD